MIQRATAVVESLATGGAGIVRLEDGKVVLVPGVVPGDEVEIAVEPPKKGDRARPTARVLRVVTPGPDRVEPACADVAACGACDWMSLDAAAQGREHARIVHAELSHAVAGSVPEPRVHPAPKPLGYRTRARLHFSVDGRRIRLGYHAARSREIVEPSRCVVLEPGLFEAARGLVERLAGVRLEGEVSVAWGKRDGARAPVVELRTNGDAPPVFWGAVDELVRRGELAGASVALAGAARPAVFGDPRPVQTGFDGLPIVLPAGGFAQPSDEGAALLTRRVAELASTEGADVHELFAGAGTLTIGLARGARLTSIEVDEAAVACARENLAVRELAGKLSVGDAETAPIPKRASVVVLDPPRTGAPGATRAIAKARPKRVVYVSCDPATLARDARGLATAGYVITALEIFELFPQTSHVETVAVFERAAGSAS